MAHPNKQIQTLVNKLAKIAVELKNNKTPIQQVRQQYQTSNPPVTGTIIEGRVSAINAWANAVIALADDPVTQELIDKQSPSYRNKAFD